MTRAPADHRGIGDTEQDLGERRMEAEHHKHGDKDGRQNRPDGRPAGNKHAQQGRQQRQPTNAGTPLNPAASSASVRLTAINLPMLLQLNMATNCASGNTITIKPAISFIGSIIRCGRSPDGGFCRWRCRMRAKRRRRRELSAAQCPE